VRKSRGKIVTVMQANQSPHSRLARISVNVMSDQPGHVSISFTLEPYSHVLPRDQDKAEAKVEWLPVA
jgi:hypothetical protein